MAAAIIAYNAFLNFWFAMFRQFITTEDLKSAIIGGMTEFEMWEVLRNFQGMKWNYRFMKYVLASIVIVVDHKKAIKRSNRWLRQRENEIRRDALNRMIDLAVDWNLSEFARTYVAPPVKS
jgi:hypothetical protein